MIFLITYVTKPVLSKFVRCDWFFLCQYFAAELLLFFGAKPAYSKFTTKQPIKVNMVIFSFSAKLLKKAEKTKNLLFKISKIDEEDEHSPSEFYHPDLNICKLLMRALKQAVHFTIRN